MAKNIVSGKFNSAVYVARRDRLLSLIGEAVAIIPSTGYDGTGMTFRQASDFEYFTGLEIPNSTLMLLGKTGEVRLYVPDRDERFYRIGRENAFRGRPIFQDSSLVETSGIQDMRRAETLERDLVDLSRKGSRVSVNWGTSLLPTPLEGQFLRAPSPGLYARRELIQLLGEPSVDNLYSSVARLRQVKGAEELDLIRKSCSITSRALVEAMQNVRPGMTERDLEAIIEHYFKRQGSPRIPFSSIVKSGPNSVLPWPILGAYYDRKNRVMEDGELVIADVGCELEYYISDVARTIPVSGRFTEEQRRMYNVVLDASDAAQEAVRPGATWKEVENAARACCPSEYAQWWDPGLGHYIGMDSSDPADYERPLEPGMVFTIEPRMYVTERDLGVMVEDNVCVTETGAELLTYEAPRTVEEIEAVARRN